MSQLIAASSVLSAVLALGLSSAFASGGTSPVIPEEAGTALRTALEPDTRMVIVFHSEVFRCTPQEATAVRALRRVEAEMPHVEIATVFPARSKAPEALYGERLPGRRVEISDERFFEEGKRAPRPRLEVWDRQGRLLLLLGLHSATTEEEVFNSVFWSRSFTKPVGE